MQSVIAIISSIFHLREEWVQNVRGHLNIKARQEMPTNGGTKAGDVLDNFFSRQI